MPSGRHADRMHFNLVRLGYILAAHYRRRPLAARGDDGVTSAPIQPISGGLPDRHLGPNDVGQIGQFTAEHAEEVVGGHDADQDSVLIDNRKPAYT